MKARATARRHVAVAAAALAVFVVITACTGSDSQGSSEPSPAGGSSPTPSATPFVDPQHVEVLVAYEGYVQASNEAANRGDPDYPALAEYAQGPALQRDRAAIRDHADNGRVYTGSRVVTAATVTELDLDIDPAQAVIEACVDISDYVLVYVEDGLPVPVDRGLEEYMVSVNLVRTEEPRWVVIGTEAHRETPCEPG